MTSKEAREARDMASGPQGASGPDTAVEIIDATCSDSTCEGKDTYRMEVRCLNCGWRGEQRITVGHDPHVGRATGAECPRCEVRWLSQGAFVIREPTTESESHAS